MIALLGLIWDLRAVIDWAAEHAAADRQNKAAAAVRFFAGLVFSAVGLAAAALIYAASHNMVIAGIAAASGMVVGLLMSRRGRKQLLGLPLVVEGAVQARQVEGSLVVIDVRAAHVLHPGGERIADPERVGPRTLPARRDLFDTLKVGAEVCLVCLPNGLAVRLVAMDPPTKKSARLG